MFFLSAVDLLINGPVDNCVACGGTHGECGKIARHLNRTFFDGIYCTPGSLVEVRVQTAACGWLPERILINVWLLVFFTLLQPGPWFEALLQSYQAYLPMAPAAWTPPTCLSFSAAPPTACWAPGGRPCPAPAGPPRAAAGLSPPPCASAPSPPSFAHEPPQEHCGNCKTQQPKEADGCCWRKIYLDENKILWHLTFDHISHLMTLMAIHEVLHFMTFEMSWHLKIHDIWHLIS